MDQLELQEVIIHHLENDQYFEVQPLLAEYLTRFGRDDFYYLAQSDIHLGFEEYDEVIALITQARGEIGDSPLFFERLGEAYFHMGDLDKAREVFSQVNLQEDDPDNFHLIFMMGQVYYWKKDWKTAVSYFEDILLESSDELSIYFAGDCYFHLGKKERALEYFDKVISNQKILQIICSDLYRELDLEQLNTYLARLEAPNYYKEHLRAENLITRQEYGKALDHAQAAAAESGHPTQYCLCAHLYEKAGDPAKAQIFLRRALRADYQAEKCDWLDESQAALNRVAALGMLKYTPRTTWTYLKQMAQAYEKKPDSYFKILDFCLSQKMYSQAWKLCQAFPVHPDSPDTRLSWLEYQASIGLKAQESQEVFKLLENNPHLSSSRLDYCRAVSSFQSYHFEEALQASRRAMPDGLMAMIEYESLNGLHRYEEAMNALKTFKEYVDGHPDEKIPHMEFFEHCLESSR